MTCDLIGPLIVISSVPTPRNMNGRYLREASHQNPDHHSSKYKSDPDNNLRSFIGIKSKEKGTLHEFQPLKKETHFRYDFCTLFSNPVYFI